MICSLRLSFGARRAEIIEFGNLPIAKWLAGDDGLTAVQQLQQQLLDAAACTPEGQCKVLLYVSADRLAHRCGSLVNMCCND